MQVDSGKFDESAEIEAAEHAVDFAEAAMSVARERMSTAADMLRQAQSALVVVQEKHGIPVPEWPEHRLLGHRWWAAEVPKPR
jgi:hypothetical protein